VDADDEVPFWALTWGRLRLRDRGRRAQLCHCLHVRDASAQVADIAVDRAVGKGDFSPEDCDDHLSDRLAHNGQPLIGPQLRHAITERSHGLPLYLDLAVMRFLEIRRNGRVPQPDDFGDFPALIPAPSAT
jgi:hypothetical protein